MEDTKLITDTELEGIMLRSAMSLPDSPSDRGMRPAQIKRALAEPVRLLAQLLNSKFKFMSTDGSLVLLEMTNAQVDELFA
ncbi:MAG: hypothetical protein IJ445_05810 [Clostridia bacterium]|nr:hypothetical protein [Clostridia bacterium]